MTFDPQNLRGATPRTLLFGSLALSFDSAAFQHLRKSITSTDSLTWLFDVLCSLAEDSARVFAAVPLLQQPHLRDELLQVSDALSTGRAMEHFHSHLSNTVLVPLVIASHLAQYMTHLEHEGTTHEEYVSLGDGEVTGLCTGLLSAFAVAASHDGAELEKHGAAAVRLGMLVGLAIDMGDALAPHESLSVGWKSAQEHDGVIQALKSCQGAYTSVRYDENRATVTAPAALASQLQHELRAQNLTASKINLFGCFHSPKNGDMLKHLLAFCEQNVDFQLPDAPQSAIPAHWGPAMSQHDNTQGALHTHALRAILVDSPTWHQIVSDSQACKDDSRLLLSFGSERCVPPSVARRIGARYVHIADPTSKGALSRDDEAYPERPWRDSDIAVVGMACKLPGANDVAEFWDLLASAQSQHQEIGQGHPRFDFADTPTRSVDDPGMKRRWFANLMSSVEQFDHIFFKRSARESASMDPAQRLLLQVAYQAVEQSAYFNNQSTGEGEGDRNVGVFIGMTGNDYQANAASQAANAFTTTGNLQGFVAGKVSHHFGWTGPAMVVDTACSGSLVAITQACRALVSGDCSAALAGGAHVMTQPAWFQNLAAGQFLSPTGQCKPFDAAADGYCRGEGIGAVFLKHMDRAVADGDNVLGVIAATAVQQNQNCTPIFVPNVPSLGDLFRGVVSEAGVKPSQISVVEAHGTGTPVGDPVEYASIKEVLGGANRAPEKPLILGSVKGLVGHLEGTSGVVALIKLLLMVHVGLVPPQASFTTLNPSIKAQPTDNMSISTKLQPWDVGFRIALINNYGASGSNASMVVAQPPVPRAPRRNTMPEGVRYPFWLSAHDSHSLARRMKALRSYIHRMKGRHSLANLSYNVARQNNRALDHRIVLSATSLDDLDDKIASPPSSDVQPRDEKAVVLCFGGQISTSIGLDRQLYDSVALLRKHLNRVDAVARSLGVTSIFPSIFQRGPIEDTVLLQVALFAMQYACARSWLDSGVKPVAVVGHSFGELTALCISQALSLEDTVKMIVSRATLVRDAWGPDKGAMIAVSDVDLVDVQKLLVEANSKHEGSPASVTCFNGPRSFTLAGSTTAMDAVAKTLAKSFPTEIKSKRLNVSNAFHCALVDGLVDSLEKGAQGLRFRDPVIPMERATASPAPSGKLEARFVADHMRSPVHFQSALERIVAKHATRSLIFLEAGSNSTITHMASRALASSHKNTHFQAVNITNCEDAWNKLADITVALWRIGLPVNSWLHHPLQARQSSDLSPMLLPAYPFNPEAQHWIRLKVPPKQAVSMAVLNNESSRTSAPTEGLVIFAGYQDGAAQQVAQFRINTSNPVLENLLSGHMTLQTAPICPATVQIGLVVDGITTIRPAYKEKKYTPQFQDIQYQSPMCASSTVATWIVAEEEESGATGRDVWRFEVYNTDLPSAANNTKNKNSKSLHTTGRVIFMSADNASLQRELAYFPRLVDHGRVTDLLTSPDVDEVLAQRNIYRMFAEIVDYGEEYRGLHKLVGRGNEAAGVVVPTGKGRGHAAATVTEGGLVMFDPHLSDTFCQVAGLWANFFNPRSPSDAYLANGIGQWIRAPPKETVPASLHIFSTSHRSSDKVFLSDVFVFDATDGSLLEVILGIAYYQLPKNAMGKVLRRLSDPRWLASTATTSTELPNAAEVLQSKPVPTQKLPVAAAPKTPRVSHDGIFKVVKKIIADLSSLEPHEIKADSELADIGIDSLVGMELINELEAAFEVKLPDDEIQNVTDIPGVMKCILGVLGGDADVQSGDNSYASSESNALEGTGYTTPGSTGFPEAKSFGFSLPFDAVMGAFDEIKALTDERIADVGQTRYVTETLPLQDELTVALTLEAFEKQGAGIGEAQPGQRLARISHKPEHQHLVSYLYRMLDVLTQVVKVDGEDNITRTAVPLPSRPSHAVYDDLTKRFPDQETANKLVYYAGTKLADVLSGATDGVKLIFGSSQGRKLAAGFYGDWPLNRATYAGTEDFLTRLVERLSTSGEGINVEDPLRILEMGAGTGGTTKRLVPLLAKLGVPVEYTFTDLSPSLVAQARKRWGQQYPFMRFAVHDIEQPPAAEFVGSQHLVIASNAVHATRSIQDSTSHIRNMLRPDGFLCLVEMTRPMYWVDIVFGLFEGWWMMADGREHVITHETRWEADLHASGYGHVDWIDGDSAESKIWKLIIASADPNSRCNHIVTPSKPEVGVIASLSNERSSECEDREQVVAKYVNELTVDWDHAIRSSTSSHSQHGFPERRRGKCVLITGGTGGLGSHLVAQALGRHEVTRVVCLNRRNRHHDARQRQAEALLDKGTGVSLDDVMGRIDVIEADISKPHLGLSEETYNELVDTVTHIVHNAWLMHFKWPVKRFEPQLRIMANMIGLARDISVRRGPETVVTFETVSSIATVGRYPLLSGSPVVPEARMSIESVLPSGYGDAKYVCERLLDATLHRHPKRFRATAVRLGQIAGSSINGYWNHSEHVAFLVKSSQTLGALPALGGSLGWTAVDDVAGTLVDILLQPDNVQLHPIYHIENPVRQPWSAMVATLAKALNIPAVVPFDEWTRRVRQWPVKADNTADGANPAFLLVDFFDDNFIRMSCGGLLMSTARAREHSPTLAGVGPVSEDTTKLFVSRWREVGFLK
ncbi:putative polyketide synthase [Astrocystis sublimbata]|nr:putative polyketide synthase [Astrocystis sublimbata]